MKKFAVLTLAALLVVAFSVPASALENVFGGYWRTRLYHQEDFNGQDNLNLPVFDDDGNQTGTQKSDGDTSVVDTRTRIYYTAKFSDNFKFVNKFEFDAVWGTDGPTGDGDFGTDGVGLEIKNTYADFTLNMLNFKVGLQGQAVSRGFLFDDDFAGAVITYKGDPVTIPVFWMKAFEGGTDNNSADIDYWGINPSFNLDVLTINPSFVFVHSSDANNFGVAQTSGQLGSEDSNLYFLSLNLDANLDLFSVWGTFIYEGGTLDNFQGNNARAVDADVAAYLAAVGASANVGPLDAHTQFFIASGDDDPLDEDVEAFFVPSNSDFKGQSYYWSEIMGYGVFDNEVSAGSPADKISNIWAVNGGASMKPTDKLKVGLDLWYAQLVEENSVGEDVLGFEIDAKITYQLMENLNLDLIGAYLIAGDATASQGRRENEDNPWEAGTRLSLSF